MDDYLRELHRDVERIGNSSPPSIRIDIEDLMTDVAGKMRDSKGLRQDLHRISTLVDTLYIDVYETDQ